MTKDEMLAEFCVVQETDARLIDEYANICDTWADESRRGGWSTHQVQANLETANSMRRLAAAIRKRVEKMRSMGAESPGPGRLGEATELLDKVIGVPMPDQLYQRIATFLGK